jgi:hypothetical protein
MQKITIDIVLLTSTTLHDEYRFGGLAAFTNQPSEMRVIPFSIHSPSSPRINFFQTLVLTLEGAAEGGGGGEQKPGFSIKLC